jgi:hypothetical protein
MTVVLDCCRFSWSRLVSGSGTRRHRSELILIPQNGDAETYYGDQALNRNLPVKNYR